jgi:putative NIF3 family GTP cyclohydrolase 1 type 2
MVVHEPTFYDHWDLDGGMKGNPLSVKKLKMIKDSAITIIRCHDVWDVMPEHGIPFAWAKFLDLGIPVKSNVYYHICKIKPQSAEAFCRHVASKTAKIGQPVVGFYGDGDTEIENVGIGTGCACEPFILYEMGADIVISIDDTVRTWIECEWSHDCGKPLIVVNHGVSEEPGIVSLAEFIKKKFPEIPVTHIPQGSTYKAVGAREF